MPDLTPFGQDVYACVKMKKGENAPVLSMLQQTTGLDMSNLSKYFNGKKKPSLPTVMRVVTVLHPDADTAHKLIRAAGYDISDLRIKGNLEYQQMLEEDDIEALGELFWRATGDDNFNPKSGIFYPLVELL